MSKLRYPNKIIPPYYQSVFVRQRLFDLLTENKYRPLVWVNGSAGSGKTILVSSWLQNQQARFLWYRMDSGNNQSADLFYFLSLSAQRNYPEKNFKLPVFTAEYANDISAFAGVFFRQLFALLDKETAIVFDNSQEIENDPDFFQVLQIALQELPEGLRIICISRNRPAALFSRLFLSNDLQDLGAETLRFTDTESAAFINWLNPGIDAKIASILESKAAGWAAALVLLSEQNKLAEVPEEMSVLLEQQDVFNFLMSEILATMNETAIQFLTKTAVFSCFTAAMAVQLTSNQNADNILNGLLNKNILIDRTEDTNPVYCYHPLLRELLQQRLKSLFTNAQLIELNRSAIRILIKQKKNEEAIPFYVQLQDWKGLKSMLLEQSETLINNGRHSAVIEWMQQLPDEMIINDPWLMYWYASAIKPLDSNRCAELLDQCYRQFLIRKDTLGLYSTWQLAVEAIFISLDDNTPLEIWFQRFEELNEYHPHCPSFELKIKFAITAIQALAFYNPQHPWLKKLLKISEFGFRIIPIRSLQHLLCSQLGHYYLAVNEFSKLELVKPYLLSAIDNEEIPLIPRSMNALLVGFLNMYQGNGDSALNYLLMALDIQEQAAIPLFKPILKLHQAGCHICRGDLARAEHSLNDAFADINPKQRLVSSLFHFYSGWLYALKGQLTLALEQNEQALIVSQAIKNDVGTVHFLGLKTKLLAKTEQWEAAEQTCSLLAELALRSPNKNYQLEYYLCDAWLGFLLKDNKRALLRIEQFFAVVSGEQIRFFFGWQPDVITPLCLLAIEHGIEAEFALSMMQVNALCPPPPKHLEQWPWPLRIYCFDQVRIELDGQLLKQEGKSQKKVIELLLTIIALGSQEVPCEQICDLLWPDSEADLAQQTLKTAIFRLRKLIGKSAVLVSDGRVSLNDNNCWIDVWAFENTLNGLNDVLQQEDNDALINTLSDRLLHFYQGPFLKQVDSSAVTLKQEQLQNKMVRLLNRLTLYHKKREEHSRISWLLEQGLERIPQLEADYQAHIAHHQKGANT
ncbi:MAG: hypothetical protein ACU88J_09905 [Gammaproteobacteria bacterium]